MYQMYLYQDPEEPEKRSAMLREAALRHAPWLKEVQLDFGRTEAGKPYFTSWPASGVQFSISHSGGLWAFILGPVRIGLDVQICRSCRHDEIAARFFTAAETEYVRQEGISGFYQIWTRREAFAKYTGLGFFGTAGVRPDLVENGMLRETVPWEDRTLWIREIPMEHPFAAAWCVDDEKEELQIVRSAEIGRF